MPNPFEDDNAEYIILVNEEQQYSLWPEFRSIPKGWTRVGTSGKRKECLGWIEKNWTDMRPKSLAIRMDASRAKGVAK
jgi:MbtH protein